MIMMVYINLLCDVHISENGDFCQSMSLIFHAQELRKFRWAAVCGNTGGGIVLARTLAVILILDREFGRYTLGCSHQIMLSRYCLADSFDFDN
jgi:hypothetical protein